MHFLRKNCARRLWWIALVPFLSFASYALAETGPDWQQIVAANSANEQALAGLVFCERVVRREIPVEGFYADLRQRRELLLLSDIQDLRNEGQSEEADQAEADMPAELAAYERSLRVWQINNYQEYNRDRIVDLVGGRMRDDIRDARDLDVLAAIHALDSEQQINLLMDRVEIRSPEGRITLFPPDMAVRRNESTTMELEIARMSRGLMPSFLLRATVSVCRQHAGNPELVEVLATLGANHILGVFRPDANFRLAHLEVADSNGMILQRYEARDYETSGNHQFPSRLSYSIADQEGAERLYVLIHVDGVIEAPQPLNEYWAIPTGYRIQPL